MTKFVQLGRGLIAVPAKERLGAKGDRETFFYHPTEDGVCGRAYPLLYKKALQLL